MPEGSTRSRRVEPFDVLFGVKNGMKALLLSSVAVDDNGAVNPIDYTHGILSIICFFEAEEYDVRLWLLSV